MVSVVDSFFLVFLKNGIENRERNDVKNDPKIAIFLKCLFLI